MDVTEAGIHYGFSADLRPQLAASNFAYFLSETKRERMHSFIVAIASIRLSYTLN